MQRFNLHAAQFQRDEGDPEGYDTGYVRLAPDIGAERLGGTVYELPPGQSICPYHYEYGNEEWLIVLAGRPTLRHPGGEDVLAEGDVVCFPTGPDGAHKVTNRAEGTARVLMLSTMQQPGVAVYPDSDKIGVFPGGPRDRLMVRRESDVPYWDRET